jgi:DNA-binding MarR family transcriptional regulator
MKLIPKNWNEFQQYKDRKPSWIKLHRDLLNDFAYSSVQIGTKATLPLLWLLACEYDDGIIDASVEEIAFRIHIDEKTVDKAIKELIDKKFFTVVQDCTETYKMVPREEKRREEKKTEIEEEIEGINPIALEEWLKYKGSRYSKQGKTLAINFLKSYSGDQQLEIVRASIMNNWKGLFEPKQKSKTSGVSEIDQMVKDNKISSHAAQTMAAGMRIFGGQND